MSSPNPLHSNRPPQVHVVRPRCPRSPGTQSVRRSFPAANFPEISNGSNGKFLCMYILYRKTRSARSCRPPTPSTPTSPAAELCHHHPPDTIVPPPPPPPVHSIPTSPPLGDIHCTHIAPAARQPPHTKPPKPTDRRCFAQPMRAEAIAAGNNSTPRASDWGFSREPHSRLVVLPVRSSSPLLLRLRRGWCSR